MGCRSFTPPPCRAALALLSLTLFAACAPAPDPAPTATPEPGAATTPAAEPAPPAEGINQTARAELAVGGELGLGVTEWAEDWNPLRADLPDQVDLILEALLPRLFDASAAGVLTPNPDWLAGPPDVTHDPVTTVTYHLNPEIRWGDGRAVSAADFAATWQFCLTAEAACAGPGFDLVGSVAAGESATDVVVTYTQPYAEWAHTFRTLLRAGSSGPWTDLAAHPEWFAGPYTVAAYSAAGTLTLTPNPQWWGEAPLLDEITVRALDEADLADAHAAGLIDSWPVGLSAAAYLEAAAADGVQLRRADSATWRVLLVGQSGPLGALELRQALLRGLDRARIGRADHPGIAWEPTLQNHFAWQAGQAGYEDLAAATGLAFDTAAATAFFATLQRLTITFLVDPGDPWSESEALQVHSQLAAFGVTVNLVYPDAAGYAAALAAGDFGLTTAVWTNTLTPALDLPARFTTTGAANWGGYSDAVEDARLARLAGVTDADGQAAILAAGARVWWAEVAAIPLYVVPETWAAEADLANFGPAGLATLRWEQVGWAD